MFDRALPSAVRAFVLCAIAAAVGNSHATTVALPVDLSGSTATQSSTYDPAFSADRGIDGNLGNFTHTQIPEAQPFWVLDLPATTSFNLIRVWNRGDGCCQERLQDITVEVFSDLAQGTEVYDSGLLNPGNALNGPRRLGVLPSGGVSGRVVKVSRTAFDPNTHDGSVLSLGEVQLFNFSEQTLPLGTDLTRANILNMTVAQSSTLAGYTADLAVNGNNGDFTHTNVSDTTPFWEVNFGENLQLQTVNLHNRESCCGSRLRDITIEVLNNAGQMVFTSPLLNPENASNPTADPLLGPSDIFFDFAGANGGSPLFGQTVRVRRTGDPDLSGSAGQGNDGEPYVLSLGEVTVVGGSVPEPSSLALLGGVALALSGLRRFRR